MTNFVREFEEILAEHQIRSGSKIFEIAGLDKSMLSRIRAGARIQFDEIPRVASAIGADDMIYLRLKRARLLEECSDPRDSRIEIEISGHSRSMLLHEETSLNLATLPPKQAEAIRNIVENLSADAGLRKTVTWLGSEVFDKNKKPVSYRKQKKSNLPRTRPDKLVATEERRILATSKKNPPA